MRSAPAIMEWFRDEPLPAVIPDPAIVLGGSRLLGEFLATAATFPGGDLAVAVPYVGRAATGGLDPWDALPHRDVEFTLVTHATGDAREAREQLMRFPWRSLIIRVRPRLHTKLYAFLGASGGGACLIGSHNLSRGGQGGNHEAGTLLISYRDPGVTGIIRACHDHVKALGRKGATFIDTLHWPAQPDQMIPS